MKLKDRFAELRAISTDRYRILSSEQKPDLRRLLDFTDKAIAALRPFAEMQQPHYAECICLGCDAKAVLALLEKEIS